MRESFDCALVMTPDSQEWAAQWEGSHAKGRLQVKQLDGVANMLLDDPTCILRSMAGILKAYDACLLPVSSRNLAWARLALFKAGPALETPVIILSQGLQTVALYDLICMGVKDFIRVPGCPEELRARLEKIRFERIQQRQSAYAGGQDDPPAEVLCEPAADSELPDDEVDIFSQTEDVVLETCLRRKGIGLTAFAAAAANRCATTQLPFKEAKQQVVAGFEQAYVSAALGRCGGNIAQAAHYSDKHRRAFWALVRKHDIDAAQFRRSEAPFPGQGG